ncbi:DUF6760 family protein [Oculatella sp. LEGE 06141]|uniref:DUF6760 family protein n=1 Tax=Oculatella sp. LEGE 06141 TaxID=1828648 RepID=UPI00351C9786
MSPLSNGICSGVDFVGGVLSYPSEQLYEEVAFIAYHFHWSQDELLNLEHIDRQRWVKEISRINQRSQPLS